jgi:hypothetical protein
VTSRYIVFQYLPDPLTDERINFGVATYGSGGLHEKFVSNWSRVRLFGDGDIGFLQEFAREVEQNADHTLLADPETATRVLFEDAPASWINSIHVTAPRASTKPAGDLLDDVAHVFLRSRPRRSRAKDRRWVRQSAHAALVDAIRAAGRPQPGLQVKTSVRLPGEVEEHEFDITVENGGVELAALALSFQKQGHRELQLEYASAAWAIEDVRKRDDTLPMAVVMLPPVKGTSKTYEQARHVFGALEARPVAEPELHDWAADVARELAI